MKKRVSLFSSVIWCFNTGCWVMILGVDWYYKSTPRWLTAMHGITALTSLTATIVNWIRYINQKNEDMKSVAD